MYDYKNGKVTGHAKNANQAASSILSLMISGALSSFRDVAALYPVHKPIASQIFIKSQRIIRELEEIGFLMIAYICDNHRKNQATFNLFASSVGLEDGAFVIPTSLWLQPTIFSLDGSCAHLQEHQKQLESFGRTSLSQKTHRSHTNKSHSEVVPFTALLLDPKKFFIKNHESYKSCCQSK